MSTVLVVGSGGREHALAWKLSLSPRVGRVIVVPGNDGMPETFERWKIPLRADEYPGLAARALKEKVDLAVIGPDNALAEGIADAFRECGVPCFGPSKRAARIEASKAFAKEIMRSGGIPTAHFFVAGSHREAETILESLPWTPETGWVVKADGLALGKGVRVCSRLNEALEAARELIQISGQLVIEERLSGEELSWMAFCDGERCSLLEPARDYKRVSDGDRGPNTGGMGAFSPVPGVPAAFARRVREEVFLPALRELKRRGSAFTGLLYAGLMADFSAGKFWVIEFNARFGDPEAQVLLPRMDADLYDWCQASAQGRLASMPESVPFSPASAVAVIGAAAGYPGTPERGKPLAGMPQSEPKGDPPYFCAGVERKDGNLVSSGGRVFAAMGYGKDLEQARKQAYERMGHVKFQGMHFRKDIAEVKSVQVRGKRP
jgi:phosphoribosylamine--glycine ligase